MRALTAAAAAAALAGLIGCAAPEARQAGLEAAPELAGAWLAVAAQRDGAPAPDVVGHRLILSGETFEIVGVDGVVLYDGRFAADAGPSPATIDFENLRGGAAGETWLGIWTRLGDALTIVDNAPDPTRPRPQEFAAPAGSGYVAVNFVRD